ncbi:MAG: RagB/SusD family nutrient uptake outer membrane protein [Candidatus Pedobacter colombiensis]|uniref:RagB/SusD family nutrient uptake outer membrane protein n=1 Tax=Candidatus Pedobacter colombiensis TaxID=3121371 RepID=A0AAJ5W7S0_9SPHI|nr:RagB/SusD family nutrient uptake outer membrane protein [Pedobacter sp.]WEK18640.1 MAG: RagB/SusD family nutrient uptake outer membrane protein [Pedobacter sp.]
MKRIYLYQLLVLVVLSITACNKQLDLAPENNLVEDQVLEDKVTAERLVAGGFYSQFLVERNTLPVIDFSTGITTQATNNYYTGSIDENLSTVKDIWAGHYVVINIANVIINNLPSKAKFEVEIQKRLIAEAKFLRAFSYFRLAILYGDRIFDGPSAANNPCVPLRLEGFVRSGAEQIIPRATNKQIIDKVLKDLEEAIPDLPTNYPDAPSGTQDVKLRSRAVKAVGRAFLSRVYLYLNNYDGAISNADLVLGDPNYELAASPAVVFPNNLTVSSGPSNIPYNKEVVYGYPVSWNLYSTSSTTHSYQYNFDATFLNTYMANDMRSTTMVRSVTVLGVTGPRSNKYTSPGLLDNEMIIRLAEVVLTKAEALARRDGVNQTSVDLLNSIYQRAFVAGQKPVPYTMASFATKDALVSRILQERRWELAAEGHDRFDKLRAGLPVNPVLPAGKNTFPIPQTEINITSGVIVQNPGYQK